MKWYEKISFGVVTFGLLDCTFAFFTYFNVLVQQRRRIYSNVISVSPFSSCFCTNTLMVQVQHWLLPREAYFSHMFPTFISSNGPICLSKCVCCVLFPAQFVPMPSLQWAPLSPGVRTEASCYLYRLNSWGPPSQRSRGWGEKLSWKVQVKPSVG